MRVLMEVRDGTKPDGMMGGEVMQKGLSRRIGGASEQGGLP